MKYQKGGSCNYALLSDVFPKQEVVVEEVKNIMDASIKGTVPMTEQQAVETSEVVVDTVQEIVPGISPGKIQEVVQASISENNVQMGGKPLRKTVMARIKKAMKPKPKTATKAKSKTATKAKPKPKTAVKPKPKVSPKKK